MAPEVLDAPKSTVDNSLDSLYQLVLYNDDVNTFEHVVACLVTVLRQPKQLAEHLAKQAHENGREVIEVGSRDDMIVYKQKLQTLRLTVEVEKI